MDKKKELLKDFIRDDDLSEEHDSGEDFSQELWDVLEEANRSDHPLAKLMHELGTEMSYYELRAYILGTVLGLEYVPPSHLISGVLLQETDEEIGFKNKKQANIFFSLFMELWNQLADWSKDGPSPIFDRVSDLTAPASVFFNLFFRRYAEAHNLLTSLAETGADIDTIEDKEALSAFNWLISYWEKLDELFDKVAKSVSSPDDSTRLEMKELLTEGDRLWPDHYRALASGLRKQRMRFLGEQSSSAPAWIDEFETFERVEPKVGRNELCPCGSGKKLKKCCLH
jgi:hypothetical protein